MSSVMIIEKAIKSGVLIDGLTIIPDRGASDTEIVEEEKKLPRPLSSQHKAILKRWNGMNMDIMRLYGCADVHEELRRLCDSQIDMFSEVEGAIVFADDPSGFIYAESLTGSVHSIQAANGEMKVLAASIDDFFERLVFGKDAKEFGGVEWEEELADCGLL